MTRRLIGRAGSGSAPVLGALGLLVYGPHVLAGGFHYDDWFNAEAYRDAGQPAFTAGVEAIADHLGGRSALAVVLALPHALLGLHPTLHLLLGLALAVAVSVALCVLLVRIGVERRHALAIASLALIYPWADATRLWATGTINNLPLLLFLVGQLTAMGGPRYPRGAAPRRAAAIALFFLGALIYEGVAGLVLLNPLLYRRRRSWTDALRRAAPDVAVVGVAVLLAGRHVEPLSALPGHLRAYAGAFVPLLTSSLLPVGLSDALRAGAVASGGVAVLLAGRPWRQAVRRDPGVRRWAGRAVLAGAATSAGYVPFVLSDLFPDGRGIDNRVNLVAALGIAALVYCLLALASALLAAGIGPNVRLGRALLPCAALAVAVGYVVAVRRDEVRWERATADQRAVLDVLAGVGRPAPGTVLYVAGLRSETARAVPVFADVLDLSAAARLRLGQRSLVAYPVFAGARLVCSSTGLRPVALPFPYDRPAAFRERGGRYGSTVMVDVRARRIVRLGDRRACAAAVGRLPLQPPSTLGRR